MRLPFRWTMYGQLGMRFAQRRWMISSSRPRTPGGYGLQALTGMQLGYVPALETYPAGQLQVQPPPETMHVPPLPHGSLLGLHALTHEIPLNRNPALHEQLYVPGATRSVHIAAASPLSLHGFDVQSLPGAAHGMVVVVVVSIVVVVDVGGGSSSVFTSVTNASTLPSIAAWSPAGATQSFLASAFEKAALYFASQAATFVESTGAFFDAAFA